MTFQIRPAQRAQAKPLIGLYSESGCGKTWSSLLLARGFVGAAGKIGMIETEAGRGEIYVGEPPVGEYLVGSMREDFSPTAYGEAIAAMEAQGVDALIIDSASHEWEGVGGVLAMAAENQAAGKKGPLVWQKPKIDHNRQFVLRLLQTPIPLVIVAMRAKYPMIEIARGDGKKDWQRSTTLEPKQSEDILYEMMFHAWIDTEHRLHLTKWPKAVPECARIFADGQSVTVETGQRLAAWAKSGGVPTATAPRTRDVLAEARDVASMGSERFRAFYKALAPAERAVLKPTMEDFKRAALAADQAPADGGDDPFGLPPIEPAKTPSPPEGQEGAKSPPPVVQAAPQAGPATDAQAAAPAPALSSGIGPIDVPSRGRARHWAGYAANLVDKLKAAKTATDHDAWIAANGPALKIMAAEDEPEHKSLMAAAAGLRSAHEAY